MDIAANVSQRLTERALMYGSDYELTRRVRVLARLDESVMTGLVLGDEMRARGMRYLARRLADHGVWTPDS